MKSYIQRDNDERCCPELLIARDKGVLHDSRFYHDKQGGLYLGKYIFGSSPGDSYHSRLLQLKYCPYCGTRFSDVTWPQGSSIPLPRPKRSQQEGLSLQIIIGLAKNNGRLRLTAESKLAVKMNMELHVRRDVTERIIIDEHCCPGLLIARDKGALCKSGFYHNKQRGLYLSIDIHGYYGGQLLRMKYCPCCGEKFEGSSIPLHRPTDEDAYESGMNIRNN